jgi:5-methylthioadenosine/S-adenosylhomocysteine deaminase
MSRENRISRRGFLEAIAALGSLGLANCATNEQKASRFSSVERTTRKLPPRGEFVVRKAYVVTMDPKLGDIPRGDVHVRNGALIAVGPNLTAPGVEEIDGSNRIALPGFIDTHFHL